MRYLLLMLILCAEVGLPARADGPRAPATAPATVPVILDTDLDSDCDDAGALAMLHALADRGEAEILAVMMSDPNGESPRCADAINTFYGRGDIPIGVRRPGGGRANSKYARAIAERFPNDLEYAAAPAAVELYRRVLAGQRDGSVVIISIGTLENLDELLDSPPDAHGPLGGVELVRRKVRLWSCMGGRYPSSGKDAEHNFKFGGKRTARAVERWPTPILFSGWELGNRIVTGARWPDRPEFEPSRHPVRLAYELYFGGPGKGRASWDQTSVLAGIRDASAYWEVRRGGRNHIFEDARNEWRDDGPPRDHAYLVERPDRAAEALRAIEDLMTHSPRRR